MIFSHSQTRTSFGIRHSYFVIDRCVQAQTSGDDKVTAKSDQKLPVPHHLFAIEPDVEIAADAVDVCFGNPVGAGVLGVGMTKGDMDTGNFFIRKM